MKEFRSGVGILFYLTNSHNLIFCNILRELLKRMDGESIDNYLGMLRFIQFALDKKFFSYLLQLEF
jgi:hypothetical protein